MKDTTEFRKDLVSGNWVLISSKIQRKPIFFEKNNTSKPLPKSRCSFENLQKSGHEEALFWLPRPGKNDFKNWWLQVVKNRYPVVETAKVCEPVFKRGIFEYTSGNGFQELVVTRDHETTPGLMSKKELELLLEAYSIRYHALKSEPCIEYILILHNKGPRAGATVPHPHSQILAIPIVPPDVGRSLRGSRIYFHKHKRCVHCDVLKWELKEKKRVIYQNRDFVAFAPYASLVSFEVRIFPKKHESRFEVIDQGQRNLLADIIKKTLFSIYKNLKDPDYNFFIHTAPPKEAHAKHYHWHIEILPRSAVWGGLELGAGVDVVKIAPEEAAKILRK